MRTILIAVSGGVIGELGASNQNEYFFNTVHTIIVA